jgi:hypothetical protein
LSDIFYSSTTDPFPEPPNEPAPERAPEPGPEPLLEPLSPDSELGSIDDNPLLCLLLFLNLFMPDDGADELEN